MEKEILHRVRILDDADEALRLLVQHIENAEKTIDIQYFIMHRGPTADLILGVLSEAADRGVKIRILLDGLATRWGVVIAFFAEYLRPEIQGFLERHENVTLKFYHALSIPFKKVNQRLHGKMVLIDGKYLISGGRNIGDKFYGKQGPVLRRLYLDRDIYVCCEAEDGVPRQAGKYFHKLWESKEVSYSPLRKLYSKGKLTKKLEKGVRKHREKVKKNISMLRADRPDIFDQSYDWLEDSFKIKNILFVSDPIGSKGDDEGTTLALYEAFASAKKSIRGQSPYIIPTQSLLESFKKAKENGAEIAFLTNSVSSSPNFVAVSTYEHYKKDLLDLGIELWEHSGTYNLHHKSYVIDDELAIMGTFNLDPRSARSNTELLYIVENKEFAAELTRIMHKYRKGAAKVTSAEKREYTPDASIGRKLFIAFLVKIAPLLKKMT